MFQFIPQDTYKWLNQKPKMFKEPKSENHLSYISTIFSSTGLIRPINYYEDPLRWLEQAEILTEHHRVRYFKILNPTSERQRSLEFLQDMDLSLRGIEFNFGRKHKKLQKKIDDFFKKMKEDYDDF